MTTPEQTAPTAGRRAREAGARARLLLGASLATLMVAAHTGGARAQSAGALLAATHQANTLARIVTAPAGTGATNGTAAAMASATARALQYQTQLNSARNMAQNAQMAARAAAAMLGSNGVNAMPIAGITLGTPVTDGLGGNGLQPAPGITAANANTAATASASDPTGVATWQGANYPTEAAGHVVNITQTDLRAVLSWTSFNVGQNTTLQFTQKLNGVDQPSWIVLNRVVGAAASPAYILGAIKAPGEVLVIDQNGIVFGPTATVNTGAIIASTLEVGASAVQQTGVITYNSLQFRNNQFLNLGLLGYSEQNVGVGLGGSATPDFSDNVAPKLSGVGVNYTIPQGNTANPYEGSVEVEAGATLTSADRGFVLLLGSNVSNAGALSSPDGEVALQTGLAVNLTASEGTASSVDPNVRGLVVTGSNADGRLADTVENAANSIIDVPRGYISLGVVGGVLTDAGVITSTTSVAANGDVKLSAGSGATLDVAQGAVIAIGPDDGGGTLPQSPISLASFKPSQVNLSGGVIDIGTGVSSNGVGSLIYAPGGVINIGGQAGVDPANAAGQSVTVESGFVIDAAGLTDVEVPATRNQIKIDPVKGNELANSPAFKTGFLDGATVYLDPRLSGVTADGVAWIGSPLIAATAYEQQVPISVSELMVAGGSVTLGANLAAAGTSFASAPSVVVKAGAAIDIAGGWRTFQAGPVRQTYIVDSAGNVIPISQANPNGDYVAIYNGYSVSQPRWGVTQTYATPLLSGITYDGAYTEGQDAGALTVISPVVALDGNLYAAAFAGPQQIVAATVGTAKGLIAGDQRPDQGAPSQLPVGGLLNIDAAAPGSATLFEGGGDIDVVSASNYVAGPGPAILLNADALSAAGLTNRNSDAAPGLGLGQISLISSGQINVQSGAALSLAPGGVFTALAGRAITVDANASITAPGGAISLQTYDFANGGPSTGSVFATSENITATSSGVPAGASPFDITVNGTLSVAGRWVNDQGRAAGDLTGSAYANGGSVTVTSAASATLAPLAQTVENAENLGVGSPALTNTDLSGSILINAGALIDASGGGYVSATGSISETSKGGNVVLYDDTTYFGYSLAGAALSFALPGFRVAGLQTMGVTSGGVAEANNTISVNPLSLNSHVTIASDDVIRDAGFAGGGTFSLTTPSITLGAGTAALVRDGAPFVPNTTAAALQGNYAATDLPLDFFSKTGFATFKITSYATDISTNDFLHANIDAFGKLTGTTSTLGGTNAVLATQVVTVGPGQTLSLNQSYFAPDLLQNQDVATLRALPSGSSLYSVLTPVAPTDPGIQLPVNLNLGGLIELNIASGGQVTGAPGATLGVSALFNMGVIRLPGGTITQSTVLPTSYDGQPSQATSLPVTSLSDVFGAGLVSEDALNTSIYGAMNLNNSGEIPTNAELIASHLLYLQGDLNPGEGVRLAAGSVTDLSGEAIVNHFAATQGDVTQPDFVSGRVIAGGSLISTDFSPANANLFATPAGSGAFAAPAPYYSGGVIFVANGRPASLTAEAADTVTGQPAAVINLDGVQATFDAPTRVSGLPTTIDVATPVWSNAGSLTLESGGVVTGATIEAQGGVDPTGVLKPAALALGGTLTEFEPTLFQNAAAIDYANSVASMENVAAPANPIGVDTITNAGFAAFVAEASLTFDGNVNLNLARGFFLTTPAAYVSSPTVYTPSGSSSLATASDQFAPLISATRPQVGNGSHPITAEITAPYIALEGGYQALMNDAQGPRAEGGGAVTLQANAIDVTGAVLFSNTVQTTNLVATGDIRLIGQGPNAALQNTSGLPTTLAGELSAFGTLNITAAQVYPTTGTDFYITASTRVGAVNFLGSGGSAPASPYSAGGSLTVLAKTIAQDGVVRVPLGALSLGSDAAVSGAQIFTALTQGVPLPATTPGLTAPATQAFATSALTLGAGSITSVSADGLSIPYGTTTDQVEYYFLPTSSAALTAPPAGRLTLAGANVNVASGAVTDLSGGGDVYAYEFISGPGGTRDVLSQTTLDSLNSTLFKSPNGQQGYVQYPDDRQVYAIVPGLSNAAVAALDPIYSANYGSLYGPSQTGLSVYLNQSPDLAAGWYTLLPAQYALLPGGVRVVQDTSATVIPPTGGATLRDGTVVTTGYFGVAGVNTRTPLPVVFDIQTQSVIATESRIALTSGDATFAAQAASAGVATPRLPIDAGSLVLQPTTALTFDGVLEDKPATGGRGAPIDISGANLVVDHGGEETPVTGSIVLTDTELNNLGAASLFLGGVRSDNSDGTTTLAVSSGTITVNQDVSLTIPELILATDGLDPSPGVGALTIAPTASIVATGAVTGESSGFYLIAGGATANQRVDFLRVSNGPERLLSRVSPAGGAAGSLVVGAATLSGTSVELDSLGASSSIASDANITATNAAISAEAITFTAGGSPGLYISPTLQTDLAKATNLTLSSPTSITLPTGASSLGNLTLDTPLLIGAGAVTVTAGNVTLADSYAGAAPCGGACGTGDFTLNADKIVFGSAKTASLETISTLGFGDGVTLNATGGVFVDGVASLDVGDGALTFNTPFLGDAATPAGPPANPTPPTVIPSLTLTTTNSLTIANAAPAPAFTSAPAGVPGASVTISGGSVAISGTAVRATAGKLTIASAGDITVSGGALLEAPAYAETFGDSADPVTRSAPGGLLSLTAQGNINFSADSQLSVGGANGQAGTLSLTAQTVAVTDASDPTNLAPLLVAGAANGGNFSLYETGAFNLDGFAASAAASQFSAGITVRTATGDLVLGAGHSLTTANLQLTADAGAVSVSGAVDADGVNGGTVDLYGLGGVDLAATASILARATGYGLTDTRQAAGGDVTLGTDGTGAISIAQGAVIDVSALQTEAHPGNRLVPLSRSDGTYYSYVPADIGGTVTLRAPLIGDGVTNGVGTVNVSVASAGSIVGASAITVQGFQHFNLTDLAGNSNYTGVTISGGTATLNLASQAAGKINALADPTGPIVSFVQNFDIAADQANLGGLWTQTNFQAQPGIELDYAGNITLASNWNLGAGRIDQMAEAAKGLLVSDSIIGPGLYSLANPTATMSEAQIEGQILSDAWAYYRVGGTFTPGGPKGASTQFVGEAPTLTIRAGGNLTLNGSITDGFFTFRDQTNAEYLASAVNTGAAYQGAVTPAFVGSGAIAAFNPARTSLAANRISITFPSAGGLDTVKTSPRYGSTTASEAPYTDASNSPAALGSLAIDPTTGLPTGDPIGSAELFPLVGANGTVVVSSSSYQLVAGATASANPLTTAPSGAGNLTVEGYHIYSYGAPTLNNSLDVNVSTNSAKNDFAAPQAWLSAFEAANPNYDGQPINDQSATTISFIGVTGATRQDLESLAAEFFGTTSTAPGLRHTSDGTAYYVTSTNLGITTISSTLSGADALLTFISNNFSQLATQYSASIPNPGGAIYAEAPTLLRTGVGAISLAASGNIDLSNSNQCNAVCEDVITPGGRGGQLGGAAVYTAGHVADLATLVTATDFSTGVTSTVSLGGNSDVPTSPGGDTTAADNTVTTDNFLNSYAYGSIGGGSSGILDFNPVYAEGGGNLYLSAGVDILSQRDTFQQLKAVNSTSNPLLGASTQPWRIGVPSNLANSVVNAQIDPQAFREGVGALGGGDITLRSGGTISDLSVVSDTSLTTGCAAASCATNVAGQAGPGSALVTLGGGQVNVYAVGDLQAGRLDVASGTALVQTEGAVTDLGLTGGATDDGLRIRLSDATVTLLVGGQATLRGVSALGISTANSATAGDQNAFGDYSAAAGLSIQANGGVNVANADGDLTVLGVASASSSTPPTIAIYPGSLDVVSFAGSINFGTNAQVVLYPSATGTLNLLAAGDISQLATSSASRLVIAQEDADPTILPGFFSTYVSGQSGLSFIFPADLPDTSDVTLREQHNSSPTHAGDTVPNRIDAGGSIDNVTLTTAKQTRIGAGLDIVNMVFEGQNVDANDVTRVVAGRDIVATSDLVSLDRNPTPPPLPTLLGNTFVLGGPGALFVEAGRNAGPFLNSAVTNANGTGEQTFGGGILTVGNLNNPWLAAQGASIFTEFGVGKGENFAGLVADYLAPQNFATDPGYLFLQTTDASGVKSPNRAEEIYSLSVTDWEKSIAPTLVASYELTAGISTPGGKLAQPPASAPAVVQYLYQLASGKLTNPTPAQALQYLPDLADQKMPLTPWLLLNYGSQLLSSAGPNATAETITYQQSYNFFLTLPALAQRQYLITNVYFNELLQASVPTSPSYLDYSRGYIAVNTLFPGSDGYTQNSLNGGPAGASSTVVTGNLDLRLATIQTDQGGNISILGPGGRVLGGSTVATAVQAGTRNYLGDALYAAASLANGNAVGGQDVSTIDSIPSGYEGVLTLQGGSINSFTDGDFLLNQSRAFTEQGGDIVLWSSNADVNAGQGPRTTADVPPLQVRIDTDGYQLINSDSAVSGAGVGAFGADDNGFAPNVFLLAPRGTVDAGDAGVRSAGNVFIAAFAVANANAISAGGSISGSGAPAAVNVSAQSTAGGNKAAEEAAQQATQSQEQITPPIIDVEVLGVLPDESTICTEEDRRHGKCE
jgi:filamentous hemagglutinin family protein